jgi:hypothetical protein
VKYDEPDVGTADADAPGESSGSVESIVVNIMDENVVWLRRPTRADACATGVWRAVARTDTCCSVVCERQALVCDVCVSDECVCARVRFRAGAA